jgi:hypothetical protein
MFLFVSLILTVHVCLGVDVGNRYEEIFDMIKPHLDDHVLVFNDVHLLLCCLGAGKNDAVQQLMQSIENFIRY